MKPTAHAHIASRITRRPAIPTPGPAADATAVGSVQPPSGGYCTGDDLLKCCKYADSTVLPLQFLIEDYVHHLEHHLQQIVGTY